MAQPMAARRSAVAGPGSDDDHLSVTVTRHPASESDSMSRPLFLSHSPADTVASTPAPKSRPGRVVRATALALGVALLAACGAVESRDNGGAAAGGYPDKQITVVVPYSAGGPTDTITRLIAEPMSKSLGQEVVVQNVEGAGGTVAAGQVAKGKPDGYTVLMHNIGMSTAPALYADLPYKPLEDFGTVGLVANVPMNLVGNTGFAPKTLAELVAYVKANPKKVTMANAGVGSASQLCSVLFEQAIGGDVTEVPYKGTGPALTDLVGGQVNIMCDQTTNSTNQIKAGKVKAYAVTTPERVQTQPDVPTTTEAGLPEVVVSAWHGLYVPKGTPADVVKKITDALAAALKDPKVVDELAKLGTKPVDAAEVTPEAHTTKLKEQIDFWTPKIKAAGVKAGG
jgi:tripartite-type tricarboxylate transporter receptor subunit TctC